MRNAVAYRSGFDVLMATCSWDAGGIARIEEVEASIGDRTNGNQNYGPMLP